ncbi:ABC transporter permease EcsB [Bacillus carboniphilus]|uniref:ABC transporter permease EcsB n=1 Tax=Bacillus carboniphilus TaxID=86663 RepID=A0ABN0VPL9_9BACI
MNSRKLWSNRIQEQWKDYQKYLRYMFNDHLLIVVIFVIAGGALQYQAWLQTLEPTFPAAMVLSILLALLITRSRTATFLQEADQAFLLPAEVHFRPYFWKSGVYSFLMQLAPLLIVLLVLYGIYDRVEGTQTFLSIFVFIALLKALNIWVRWMVFKERGIGRTYSPFVRYLLNASALYFFLQAEWVFLLIVLGIFLALTIILWSNTKNKLIKWDDLIAEDVQRRYEFYRFANMFTDVPKLKSRVKRRRPLDFLLPGKKGKETAYVYLFARTYIRYGDYFGLTFRLTVIGFVISFMLESVWFMLLATLITIYLTGFQLIPLFKQNAFSLWVRLYPFQAKARIQSFTKFLAGVLAIQLVILSSIFLFHQEWLFFIIAILTGYLFIFFFMKMYIEKRIQKETNMQ